MEKLTGSPFSSTPSENNPLQKTHGAPIKETLSPVEQIAQGLHVTPTETPVEPITDHSLKNISQSLTELEETFKKPDAPETENTPSSGTMAEKAKSFALSGAHKVKEAATFLKDKVMAFKENPKQSLMDTRDTIVEKGKALKEGIVDSAPYKEAKRLAKSAKGEITQTRAFKVTKETLSTVKDKIVTSTAYDHLKSATSTIKATAKLGFTAVKSKADTLKTKALQSAAYEKLKEFRNSLKGSKLEVSEPILKESISEIDDPLHPRSIIQKSKELLDEIKQTAGSISEAIETNQGQPITDEFAEWLKKASDFQQSSAERIAALDEYLKASPSNFTQNDKDELTRTVQNLQTKNEFLLENLTAFNQILNKTDNDI